MKIYRKHAVLILSAMKDKGRAFIEIAPAIGVSVKHDLGNDRFDYDNAICIGLNDLGMLTTSYKLLGMADGTSEYHGQDDTIRVATSSANKDKAFLARTIDNDFELCLTNGNKLYSVLIGRDEIYAIGMWFQFQAQKFIMQE